MKVALGEVCTARSSLVDPTTSEVAHLPHIGPDAIERDTGQLLEYRTVREDGVTSGKHRFEPGDILYSKIRPNLNKVVQVSFKGLCSADMYALKVDHARTSPEFLVRVLRSSEFLGYATRLSNRANIPKLNRDQLMRFEFVLPPLPEQRRIAAILDHVDALRAKRRQILAHLDTLTESIFHDMFSHRLPDATLGDVCDVQGGLQVSAKRGTLPIEVPYLRVANVHRGRLDLSEVKTLRATGAEIARTLLASGDLLFVEGHANPMEVGRVAMWDDEVPSCVHQNHLIRGRVDRSRTLPVFAATWFNTDPGAAHFRRAGKTTSGLNTISASTVRSAPIPLPPLDLQREFATRADLISMQRHSVHCALAVDDELFASLQSRAFRGEL